MVEFQNEKKLLIIIKLMYTSLKLSCHNDFPQSKSTSDLFYTSLKHVFYSIQFKKSQNHEIIQVGKDLEWSPV